MPLSENVARFGLILECADNRLPKVLGSEIKGGENLFRTTLTRKKFVDSLMQLDHGRHILEHFRFDRGHIGMNRAHAHSNHSKMRIQDIQRIQVSDKFLYPDQI